MIDNHKVVSHEEWLAARLELLEAEKELTRRSDELARRNAEAHEGLSAFALEDGVVYHTYSCHLRGVEAFNVTYQLLDRVPRGRDEDTLPYPRAWIRRRDEYGTASVSRSAAPTCLS